ncbi:MAG: gamma-glutamylcyclotransferase family protein [Ferrovibrio sp.]|uniref:gamma-glutamylcyclotransferase family protein n=1 Tax=Ferrovibrio sp. TaxID=1917215 RepID=UPI00391B5F60
MIFAKSPSLDYYIMYVSGPNLDHTSDASTRQAMDYFFYGTLCDPDVHRLILGYRPGPRQIRPASLAGFRRKMARGRSYPLLIPAPAGRVQGLLFTPRERGDADRLAAYEGPEYVTRRLPVRPRGAEGCRMARVFMPAPGMLPAGFGDWRLETWRRRHKTAFLLSLHRQGSTPCANR